MNHRKTGSNGGPSDGDIEELLTEFEAALATTMERLGDRTPTHPNLTRC